MANSITQTPNLTGGRTGHSRRLVEKVRLPVLLAPGGRKHCERVRGTLMDTQYVLIHGLDVAHLPTVVAVEPISCLTFVFCCFP